MVFHTVGDSKNPPILFFHAMGVTGDSSIPVAQYLKDRSFCILPTATVYCPGQTYQSRADEVRQIEAYLKFRKIEKLPLVVASSLGADLAMAFLTETGLPVEHVFFDGGQFAQISLPVRRIMTPFLYLAIRSLYWSGGKTLRQILWCDDERIRPYFIEAGKNLTFGNLSRQLRDSLPNEPFPALSEEMQRRTFWEFGSAENHYKYRKNVMTAYPFGHFPVFEGYNHMQYQIRDPEGFARMLISVMERGTLPPLPFLRTSEA